MAVYHKLDFQRMSVAEVKTHVLAHKQNTEVFYALADHLKADNQNVPWNPSPTTPEGIALMEQAFQEHLKVTKPE